MILRGAAVALVWLFLAAASAPLAGAAEGTVPGVESRLYFGMHSADGSGVSEQEWADFLREVVTPRFPDGLTVISVYGQSAGATPAAVLEERTKLLVVVHPEDAAANRKMAEIKSIYVDRFNQTSVFHTRAPVTIVTPAPPE